MECNLFKSMAIGIDLLALVRIFAGVFIMKHGLVLFNSEAMKGTITAFGGMHIPLPALMAYVAKGAEFFCGLLLVLGLLTHFAGAVLVFNMFVAVWAAFHFKIFAPGGELAFFYLLLFAVFAVIGGGKYSLDYWVFG